MVETVCSESFEEVGVFGVGGLGLLERVAAGSRIVSLICCQIHTEYVQHIGFALPPVYAESLFSSLRFQAFLKFTFQDCLCHEQTMQLKLHKLVQDGAGFDS